MVYVIKSTIKQIINNKRNQLFLVSILILFLIGAFYSIKNNEVEMEKKPQFTMGIVDKDDNLLSNMLVQYFQNNQIFNSYMNVMVGEEKELLDKFYHGELLAYVEIPKGFVEQLMYLENEPIKVKINGKDSTESIVITNLLSAYEKYISAVEKNVMYLYDVMRLSEISKDQIDQANREISMDLVMTVLEKENFFEFHERSDYPSTSLTTYYFMSFLSAAVLYYGMVVGIMMLKDRSTGMLNRYLVTGRSVLSFMIAKGVTLFILLIGIFLIPYCLSLFLINSRVNGINILVLLTYFIFSLSLAFFVSAITQTREKYILFSNSLYFFFLNFGGCIIPIKYLPDNVVNLSKITPNYWFVKAMLLGKQNNIDQGIAWVILIGGVLSVLFLFLSKTLYKRVGGRNE